MIDVLATINETHEYFRKDYSKPKKLVSEDELVAGDQLVENADGFFDSLPLAKNVKKKYRLNLNGPSKADKERKRLLRMQKAVEKMQQQLVQQQENIRMAEEKEAESSGDEVLAQARQRPVRTVINHGNDEEEKKGGDQHMADQESSSSSSEEDYLQQRVSNQGFSGSPNTISN
jgi:hypothetical protein